MNTVALWALRCNSSLLVFQLLFWAVSTKEQHLFFPSTGHKGQLEDEGKSCPWVVSGSPRRRKKHPPGLRLDAVTPYPSAWADLSPCQSLSFVLSLLSSVGGDSKEGGCRWECLEHQET